MTWRPDIVDGPLAIPVMSEPTPFVDHFGVERLARTRTGWVDGYHLNVSRPALTGASGAFEVEPQQWRPRFAGDQRDGAGMFPSTACLTFADEAEARAALPADWWIEA